MGFQGVYRALYDHEPQLGPENEGDAELPIRKGDLLYMIEKDEDANWWRARKKASSDNDDEPEGLVPKNYVEQADAIGLARALYEYTRQTEEELSLLDGSIIQVYDSSDPDWTLVGLDDAFGFVPSNYIEALDDTDARDGDGNGNGDGDQTQTDPSAPPPTLPHRPAASTEETTPPRDDGPPNHSLPLPNTEPPALMKSTPAPAVPTVLVEIARDNASTGAPTDLSSASIGSGGNDLDGRDADTNWSPPMRSHRPNAHPAEEATTPLPDRDRDRDRNRRGQGPEHTGPVGRSSPEPNMARTPGGFHLYNINEMVSVLGKKKKMPSTLGVNIVTRTILIAPERAQDGPSQEWTAGKMTHYSREGKHVFLELVKPSRSIDFHAGAKDTAEEIVSALSELAGAVRAAGLQNAILAAGGPRHKKRGTVLYDFIAQGDDEVTVCVGDEVIILDDVKSEEWWSVRRVKDGKEGVVPGSYVEAGMVLSSSSPSPLAMSTPTFPSLPSVKATVEQNRLEEKRLTNEAVNKTHPRDGSSSQQQVGPGMTLPRRGSSLLATDENNTPGQDHGKRENGGNGNSSQAKSSRSKPDGAKLRTWTDRTKSFSVEAQFLGLKDGKINLHKANGVKIAVPLSKMSAEDLEYVERVAGVSVPQAHDKPDARKPATSAITKGSESGSGIGSSRRTGATVEQARKPDYDWFQFFLTCEVPVGLCERYAQAFARDGMDESVLPDVDATVLRTLGLKEGDIIKVMRMLDSKFGRTAKRGELAAESGGTGGLFSGPGGTLRNNTKKGRPAPAVETSAVVDPKVFSGSRDDDASGKLPPAPEEQRGSANRPGFDDDAWDIKPSKSESHEQPLHGRLRAQAEASVLASTSETATPSPTPVGGGAMQELSLLTAPLQPSRSNSGANINIPASTAPAVPITTTGSTPTQSQPSFSPPATVTSSLMRPPLLDALNPQQTQSAFSHSPRQRPIAPQVTGVPQGGTLMPPPPRPLSAPHSAQSSSAFTPTPLTPQMTGQPAPPGQSLLEMSQARMQQQQPFFQPPHVAPQPSSGMVQQPTGPVGHFFNAQPQHHPLAVPSHFTAAPRTSAAHSPFSDPPSLGGFQPTFQASQALPPALTGSINSLLPPALDPQRTGTMSQFSPLQPNLQPGVPTTLLGGGGPSSLGTSVQRIQQPLQPPEVRFGISGHSGGQKSQGPRANLSQATPQNPFGLS